ncbi:MAG: hypothetical protein DRP45_07935 [Candidatus Zixiibacteriota bacterium]|nr:MAG: hypothetical protein DRP45_07935 [candidate division Zixibacteria bacterium]
MILAGDEIGRTQMGNNNAYCQDNELSWIDWNLVEKNADLLRYFRLLIKFRKDHPILMLSSFSKHDNGKDTAIWHGTEPDCPDRSYESRSLAVQFSEDHDGSLEDIYIAVNAHWDPLRFNLPLLSNGRKWYRVIDTMQSAPRDIAEPGDEPIVGPQSFYPVGPRSTIVLIGR